MWFGMSGMGWILIVAGIDIDRSSCRVLRLSSRAANQNFGESLVMAIPETFPAPDLKTYPYRSKRINPATKDALNPFRIPLLIDTRRP